MMHIRRAKTEDTAGIIRVKCTAWPEETTPTQGHIQGIITDKKHLLFVAIVDDEIVGFIDGFSTLTLTGKTQWEIDLIAVHPAYQGRGIGRRLTQVMHSSSVVASQPIDQFRAFTHMHNSGSIGLFTYLGYQAEYGYSIFVLPGLPEAPPEEISPLDERGLVMVNTVNYRGVWVEKPITPEALDHAERLKLTHGLELTGVSISARDLTEVEALLNERGFECLQNRDFVRLLLRV